MNNHVQASDNGGDIAHSDNLMVRDAQIPPLFEEDVAVTGAQDGGSRRHPSQLSDHSNHSTSTTNSSSYVNVVPNGGPSYAIADAVHSYRDSSSSDNEFVKFGQV